MRVLLWHVHGSWTTAFVQGQHEYVLPVVEDRGPDGRGRARTWDWPASVIEVPAAELRHEDVDVVVLQRPRELELVRRWTGRCPGSDLPAVYVEHDAPAGDVPLTRHPLADQTEIPVAHVTPFNDLMWDNGSAPHLVVEHGIVDPGHRWTGDVQRAAVVVNEPWRRGRVTGTDLLEPLTTKIPVDLFGMGVERGRPAWAAPPRLQLHEDLPQLRLHEQLARRRVYVHLMRWTSLGLSLLEAMALGMPVVVLGSTEAWEAVPPEAGWVTTDVSRLIDTVNDVMLDPAAAAVTGAAARFAVLGRYGLDRFLDDWDRLLKEVAR